MQPNTKNRSIFDRGITAAALGVLLPLLLPPLGVAPMLAVRKMGGRKAFFLLGAALLSALVALSVVGLTNAWVPFSAVLLITWVYTEFDELGFDTFTSGLASVIATLSLMTVSLWAWLRASSLTFRAWYGEITDEAAAALAPALESSNLVVDDFTALLPAALVVTMMLSLWFGLLYEARFRSWLGQNVVVHHSLSTFRLPSYFVWIAMASVASSFLAHGNEWIRVSGLNLFQVVLVCYFFQGLGVVSTYFRVTSLGQFWQMLWYILLVTQFLPVVSAIGFAEYWFEIRERLIKKSAQSVLK